MDKEEAERLAGAIRKMLVDWIRVLSVEINTTTYTYEVRCAYKQEQKGLVQPGNPWTTLLIKSPRQWIDLLTGRNDTLGGLELP